jgi:hypothetical protein
MTATFLNYYAPEGACGVIVCNPDRVDSDFYYLRRPQPSWHHGEAMITTNAWTDGTFTPPDEDFGADAYYDDPTPKTHESHWNLLASTGNGLHMLSVAYRGREDMTVWADGRLTGGTRTRRLEYEWAELFNLRTTIRLFIGDANGDGAIDSADAITILDYLFRTYTVPACLAQCNVNGDSGVDIADAITILGFLFMNRSMIGPDGSEITGATAGCTAYEREEVSIPCASPCMR